MFPSFSDQTRPDQTGNGILFRSDHTDQPRLTAWLTMVRSASQEPPQVMPQHDDLLSPRVTRRTHFLAEVLGSRSWSSR